jgi:hypothetical protein
MSNFFEIRASKNARRGWALGLLLAAAGLAWETRALACGGCFHPVVETEPSVVSGHRMAFAVSSTRTVLWDQFSYTGAPQDFSWVLPVKPGAYVEASSQGWFDSLEAATGMRVQSPSLFCPNNADSAGCGCGTMGADSKAMSASGGNYYGETLVTVVHQGTVGPYETVTLRSTNPDALRTWLSVNGYEIPPNIDPIISAYVNEGFDFIALRLSPGQGITQMDPVRVITPGGDYSLPLRMVAAGVSLSVPIVLYVIGEARFSMPDLAETRVDPKDVTWDFANQTSDYADVRLRTLAQNSGRSYLTSYASPEAFTRPFTDENGFTTQIQSSSGATFQNLAALYFGEELGPSTDCATALSWLSSSSPVVDPCAPGDPTSCTPVPTGSIAASSFACNGASDIATAMVGMHPSSVWLTRLELDLPLDALDHDCIVEGAVSQSSIDNHITAGSVKNSPCPEPIFASNLPHQRRPLDAPPEVAYACLIGVWLLRRGMGRA